MRPFVILLGCLFMGVLELLAGQETGSGTLVVQVRGGSRPVPQAELSAGETTALTDSNGAASFRLMAGDADLIVQRFGFKTKTARVSVAAGATTRIVVDLESEVVLKEEITVTATRTGQRIDDVPLRVEVLQQEEVEEKALMTPGDIAMLLNETGGLRVQVTSPSLGAANVRVQALRGRYTQLLADGLPLYGGQTGAIGLLQIPPLDLGQVEVIKGVASALYGSSALGGVINLVSRQPKQSERQLLLNRTTRDGTDAVFWLAEPRQSGWGLTLLGGVHAQQRTDIDGDGWSDLPGYRRGVLRPRIMWEDGKGKSVFATLGAMVEDREGGTIGSALAPDGQPFAEKLSTRRVDGGFVGRFLRGARVITVRGSGMTQWHRHQFGEVRERDRHETWFGEASVSGMDGKHTWAAGTALQTDRYRGRDVSGFNYSHVVPAVFAQDDFALNSRVTFSASARTDIHNVYGTFLNPRVSTLVRLPQQFTVRLSTGTGVFAPTPFTEETEAGGLTHLQPLGNLEAERAWGASGDLGWSNSHIALNGTIFGSVIRRPISIRRAGSGAAMAFELMNAPGPVRTFGSEVLARIHEGDFSLTLTHTSVHSSEYDLQEGGRDTVPLTPRRTASFVGTWEKEGQTRIGLEIFYTGRQRLDNDPFRSASVPYWILGVLVERRLGPVRLFINAENLGNVRQTHYGRLVRPERNFDGRWTVDAWAPLDGRVINGGIRLKF